MAQKESLLSRQIGRLKALVIGGMEPTGTFVRSGSSNPMIDRLPFHCLQSIVEPLGFEDRIAAYSTCQALREAVQSSNWNCGELVISAEYIFPRIVQDGLKVVGHVWFEGKCRRKFDADNGKAAIFLHIRRLFAKFHVDELRLENVPLENDLFQHFNDFLDNDDVTFDRLNFEGNDEPVLSKRSLELMSKAKKDVVYEAYELFVKPKFVEVLERPITFRGVGNWDASSIISEFLFYELVRKGHSIERMNVDIWKFDLLEEVIEMVSSSPIHQQIDVRVYSVDFDFHAIERYVERLKAMEVHDKAWDRDKYWPSSLSPNERKIRTYRHLGVEISLASIQGASKYARLIVKSDHYAEI